VAKVCSARPVENYVTVNQQQTESDAFSFCGIPFIAQYVIRDKTSEISTETASIFQFFSNA
jgi:hypothetical protein